MNEFRGAEVEHHLVTGLEDGIQTEARHRCCPAPHPVILRGRVKLCVFPAGIADGIGRCGQDGGGILCKFLDAQNMSVRGTESALVIRIEHVPAVVIERLRYDVTAQPPHPRLQPCDLAESVKVFRRVVAEAVAVHVDEFDRIVDLIVILSGSMMIAPIH